MDARCLVALTLAACASHPAAPCRDLTADAARAIGAQALNLPDANGPNVHVIDRGGVWLVGEWIEDLSTDDEVLLGFGGRSVEIGKCDGAAGKLRRWR